MLDLLGGGFLAPDSVPLEADHRQRRRLESDQLSHFHCEPRRCIDDAGQEIRVFERFRSIVVGAGSQRIGARRQRSSAIGDTWKADGIALLDGCRLIAPVIGRSGDNDPAHPVEDLLPLAERQAAEIVGKVQRNPALFGRTNIAEVMTEQGTGLIGQFRFEVPNRQPVSSFNAGEDFEARDGSRHTLALDPG